MTECAFGQPKSGLRTASPPNERGAAGSIAIVVSEAGGVQSKTARSLFEIAGDPDRAARPSARRIHTFATMPIARLAGQRRASALAAAPL